jgi:hypothetical protein
MFILLAKCLRLNSGFGIFLNKFKLKNRKGKERKKSFPSLFFLSRFAVKNFREKNLNFYVNKFTKVFISFIYKKNCNRLFGNE